jgi:hypothetical protein
MNEYPLICLIFGLGSMDNNPLPPVFHLIGPLPFLKQYIRITVS